MRPAMVVSAMMSSGSLACSSTVSPSAESAWTWLPGATPTASAMAAGISSVTSTISPEDRPATSARGMWAPSSVMTAAKRPTSSAWTSVTTPVAWSSASWDSPPLSARAGTASIATVALSAAATPRARARWSHLTTPGAMPCRAAPLLTMASVAPRLIIRGLEPQDN